MSSLTACTIEGRQHAGIKRPDAIRHWAAASVIALAVCTSSACGISPRPTTASGPVDPAAPRLVVAPGQAKPEFDTTGKLKRLRYADAIGDLGLDGFHLAALGAGLNLSAVRLEAGAAVSGTEVILAQVPTKMGRVRAEILKPDGTHHGWAMLRDLGETSRMALMTPALPPEILQDGNVKLAIYVRGAKSPPLTLHIDAPPPVAADQGAAAMIQKLGAIADEDPLSGGATSSFALFVHALLDDPANPNSLLKMLDGSAELLAGQATIQSAVIDGMVGQSAVVGSLDQFGQAMAQIIPPPEASSSPAGYRIQACCLAPDADSQTLTDTIAKMQEQATAVRNLESASIAAGNAFAQAAAALSGYISNGSITNGHAVAVNLVLNEAAILNLFQSLRSAASLPSRVTLERPRLHGTTQGNGQAYTSPYLAGPDDNYGYWRVDGSITTGTVQVKNSDIVGVITAPTAGLTKLQEAVGVQLLGLAADEGLHNVAVSSCQYLNGVWANIKANLPWWAAGRMDWWQPADCGATSFTYLDFVARKDTLVQAISGVLGGLQFDKATNEFSVGGEPRLWYYGDLTNHVDATFSDGSVQDLGYPARGKYVLRAGKGYPTLSVKTSPGFPAQASNFVTMRLRNAISVTGFSLDAKSLQLNVPRDAAGTVDGSPWRSAIGARVSYSDGHQDRLVAWSVPRPEWKPQSGEIAAAPYTPWGRHEIKAASLVDPTFSETITVYVNRLWKLSAYPIQNPVRVMLAPQIAMVPIGVTYFFTDGTPPKFGSSGDAELAVIWSAFRRQGDSNIRLPIQAPDAYVTDAGTLMVPPTAKEGPVVVEVRSRHASAVSTEATVEIRRDSDLVLDVQ